MALTGLAQLPPSMAALLTPGEEVLAWETVTVWGEDQTGRAADHRSVTVDLHPVSALTSGPVDVDPGLFERWFGGVGLTGHHSSTAARMGRVISRAGMPRLAVTTLRLILVEEGGVEFSTDPVTGRRTADQPTSELWSVPRIQVRAATRRPRLFMASRLVVEFSDGSTVALMCGMLSPRPAKRLQSALQMGGQGVG